MSERSTERGLCDDHAVVVIGGHPPDRRILGFLPLEHRVICADSGLDHALRLGLVPTAVVGDMDSVDPSNLAAARARNCTILEHSPDKDFTDTELALDFAVASGSRHVTLVWGGGDRIDHVLGVVAALGHPRLACVDTLRAWIATDHIDVVHEGRTIVTDIPAESTISLLPIGSRDAVVTTRGLKWDLSGEVLSGDRARGVSNVVASPPCSVTCDSGVIAVVTPGKLDVAGANRRVAP